MKISMPSDIWGNIKPRAWQARALPKLISYYTAETPKAGVVQACPRSGKSKLMAQFAACCVLEPNEVIVVSTTTQLLVEQLEQTFRERLETGGFMAGAAKIGTFYTHGKDILTPVIITCTPSVPELAKSLKAHNRVCAVWLADEMHRTGAKTIIEAYETLSPTIRCGYSATPYRADEEETLPLFDEVIPGCSYLAAEALKDNVVVPWRMVPWTGGEATLDVACIEMTDLATGPGMYNSMSIDDAEVFVKKLDAHCEEKSLAIHSKMPKAERKKRIEQLRTGQIRALVHVDMLREGVDLPWLRWICLRRPVRSRVRFVQELCRVMSSSPETGKTECVVYDPHGLIEEFKLNYKAALGGEYELDVECDKKESEIALERMQQMVFECMRELVEVKAGKKPLSTGPLEGYLRELVWAFDTCGLMNREVRSTFWRRQPSSEAQQKAIPKFKWVTGKNFVPRVHRAPLAELTGMTATMNKGACSDLMDIALSLANTKKWPDLKILDKSAEDAMKMYEENKKHLITTPKHPAPQSQPATSVKKAKKPDQPSLF